MAETRYYPGWGDRVDEACEHLTKRLRSKGYDVQVLEVRESGGGLVCQVRETYDQEWKRALSTLGGLDTAATARLWRDGDAMRVQIGGGKWLDKAAVAGVGIIASAGLLFIPAGIGAWKQKKLLDEIVDEITMFVEGRWASAAPSRPDTAQADTSVNIDKDD